MSKSIDVQWIHDGILRGRSYVARADKMGLEMGTMRVRIDPLCRQKQYVVSLYGLQGCLIADHHFTDPAEAAFDFWIITDPDTIEAAGGMREEVGECAESPYKAELSLPRPDTFGFGLKAGLVELVEIPETGHYVWAVKLGPRSYEMRYSVGTPPTVQKRATYSSEKELLKRFMAKVREHSDSGRMRFVISSLRPQAMGMMGRGQLLEPAVGESAMQCFKSTIEEVESLALQMLDRTSKSFEVPGRPDLNGRTWRSFSAGPGAAGRMTYVADFYLRVPDPGAHRAPSMHVVITVKSATEVSVQVVGQDLLFGAPTVSKSLFPSTSTAQIASVISEYWRQVGIPYLAATEGRASETHQAKARAAVEETMIGRHTLAQLKARTTISQSQFDDLKIQKGPFRVWLSRMGTEDGMPYDNQVTVEKLIRGRWTIIDQYNPALVGRAAFVHEAVPFMPLTYGTVPKLGDFELRLRDAKDEEGARLIGDPPRVFWMSMVEDEQIAAVKAIAPRLGHDIAIGPDKYYPQKTAVEVRSVKALHTLIEGLVEQWNRGIEPAGDLASSIMYILRYEWI